MKDIVKKVAIISMIAMMQIGLGASMIEASPRSDMQQQHNELQSQENKRHSREMQRQGDENVQTWHDRQVQENKQYARYARVDNERQYRNELEMQRHEKEMQPQNNESAQNLNDRQWQENQIHDKMVRQIEAEVMVMALHF